MTPEEKATEEAAFEFTYDHLELIELLTEAEKNECS